MRNGRVADFPASHGWIFSLDVYKISADLVLGDMPDACQNSAGAMQRNCGYRRMPGLVLRSLEEWESAHVSRPESMPSASLCSGSAVLPLMPTWRRPRLSLAWLRLDHLLQVLEQTAMATNWNGLPDGTTLVLGGGTAEEGSGGASRLCMEPGLRRPSLTVGGKP